MEGWQQLKEMAKEMAAKKGTNTCIFPPELIIKEGIC